MNTVTATSTGFTLADPTNEDIRRALGLTDDRASEILTTIHTGAKADGFGANIKGALWNAVGNLPTEGERLYGAWAIGHGMGMSDDDNTEDNGFGGNDNPLAALLAAFSGDDEDVPGANSEEL